MNIFLYAIIFIIGTVFGSFYTLAVYRVPKNIDIIKTHSYCPNCNHKLGFLELIPVWSYIFLGGKCKHCKQSIRPRYLILEILSGCAFLMLAQLFKINVYTLNVQKITLFALTILYFTAVVLIMSIDKEYRKIDKRVLAYGIFISLIYMIYLYTIEPTSIYRYAIYLVIFIILLAIDTILLRRLAKESYIVNVLLFLNIILVFTDLGITILTVIMASLAIAIYMLEQKIIQKKTTIKKNSLNDIPLGFYIGVSNIIILFMMNLISQLINYM